MINSYQDIQGWFDFEDIYSAVVERARDGDVFIEIGTWMGKSTAFLAQKIKESGKEIKLYAVDTFQGEDSCEFHLQTVKEHGGSIYEAFWQNMIDLKLSDYVTPIISESHKCLEQIPETKFDFIFVDGDHKADPFKRDFEYFYPVVKKGGIFGGHDYTNSVHVKNYIDEFEKSSNIPIQRVGASWLFIK